MDPNATLENLINAAVAGSESGVMFYAKILSRWLANGGFAPSDPRPTA